MINNRIYMTIIVYMHVNHVVRQNLHNSKHDYWHMHKQFSQIIACVYHQLSYQHEAMQVSQISIHTSLYEAKRDYNKNTWYFNKNYPTK